MKTKPVASGNGSVPKATACMGKASTSTFNQSGKSAKMKSNSIPGKAIL